MGRIEGKIAVITGAASGMGSATARRFADEGATVIATDIQPLDGTAAGYEGRIIPMHCDVTKPEHHEAVFAECRARFGRLDILFNNAGIGDGGFRLHETSLELWHRMIATNLDGVFYGIKFGVPLMIESGGGCILNTASTQAFRVSATGGGYPSSKAGVVQLSKLAAVEYAADNIRCNAICPGPHDTAMFNGASDELRGRIMATLPRRRMGRPEEVASLALFLASDEADFITGAAYLIDGGRLTV